jgi:hypothetical protein
MTIRVEFAPALMTRDLAAYYISGTRTDIDVLRSTGVLTAVGTGKRLKFRKADLDAYVDSLPERHKDGSA